MRFAGWVGPQVVAVAADQPGHVARIRTARDSVAEFEQGLFAFTAGDVIAGRL
jgi:hypothetical protein